MSQHMLSPQPQLDWSSIESELNERGCATTGPLLTQAQCTELSAAYNTPGLFRSRVVMARHGYGRGEYKYFAYPLPEIVASLRSALYPPLAEIANRWNAALGIATRYPVDHASYLTLCHRAGQTRPTPLMLRYAAGGYNCLHQDLYGAIAFPLQFTIMLNRPDRDFSGGEFLLLEQRPRAQSKAEAVRLEQGTAILFPGHVRPVPGRRGSSRLNVRHGVSRIHAGVRFTLGIIFHDAS